MDESSQTILGTLAITVSLFSDNIIVFFIILFLSGQVKLSVFLLCFIQVRLKEIQWVQSTGTDDVYFLPPPSVDLAGISPGSSYSKR